VKGVGDLTGDGKVDIVWRNTATGQNALWEMDGVAYVTLRWLGAVSDLNWALVGVGDMTGDGKPDIVWRNTATGQNAVWEMNGTTQTALRWLRSVSDTNWELVGVKEFVGAGTLSSLTVEPVFAPIDVGTSIQFNVTALDEYGQPAPVPSLGWSSSDPGVATVDQAGLAAAVGAGVVQIKAESTEHSILAEATLAVIGSAGLCSTAFPGGQFEAPVSRGQTIVIPVTLDMSRVSSNGNLGAAQFELLYDETVLVYSSTSEGDLGYWEVNGSVPGQVIVALASTEPKGDPDLTLVTVHLTVRADAPTDMSVLILNHTMAPVDTAFNVLSMPVSVGGKLRIMP
jgi:hypothetical protein